MRSIFFIILLMFLSQGAWCGVIPADNSVINYSTVYFEEAFRPGAVTYELVFSDSASWGFEVMRRKVRGEAPAFWVPGLLWGKAYCWTVKAYNADHKEIFASEVHRFRTLRILTKSGGEGRVFVTSNQANKHAGGFISIDYMRSVVDRTGNVIWTLPDIPGIVTGTTQIRDLKYTQDNTFTFLTPEMPVEVDLNGQVLWKGPAPLILGSDTVIYHHDFKKTSRGTYMVLGERYVYRKILGYYKDEAQINARDVKMIDSVGYKRTLIGMVLEFSKDGKLIWQWDANDYIQDKDLNFKKTPDGVTDFSSHQNGFGENEAGTKIYVSFRDLSRIIKIDKKTKKVELSYGDKYPSGDAALANNLFKNQHDANVSDHNSIYIFNNNDAKSRTGVSSVMELKDNAAATDQVLLWKFDLDFDPSANPKSNTGGNVTDLPDGNLLVCAGSLNRIFEVTKNKEVVWHAFMQEKKKEDSTWQSFAQYRCNWLPQIGRYHFMLRQSVAEATDSKALPQIVVYNTGNADDSYEIQVFSKNKQIYKINTGPVSKNGKKEQALKIPKSLKGNDLTLAVRSDRSGTLHRQPLSLQ